MINVKRCFPLVALVLCVLLFQPVIGERAVGATSTYVSYNNDKYGFSLKYPIDWVLHEGYMGTIFIALSPFEDGNDLFQENINVITEDLQGYEFTIEEYLEFTLSELQDMVDNLKVISRGKRHIAGQQGKVIVFSGEQSGFEFQWMQLFFISGTNIYVITYTAQENKYDKHLPTIENIINSIKFN